jgi:acetoin utilization deacetylase AcuC-like enzyme
LNYPFEAEVGGRWSQVLLDSIRYSNGGIRDAVISAHMNRVAGSLSSGLHHAGLDYGAGFCQVNGLVMGALMAKELGYKVGILDVDAHCGGGTHSILSSKKTGIAIADISTNTFDDYVVKDSNYNLRVVSQKEHPIYLREVQKQLDFLKSKGCNFIMVNAGMDPTLDNLSFSALKEREELIAKYIHDHDMKAVWVLAGGYLSTRVNVTKESLTDLHMATFYSFNNLFNKDKK